MYEGSARTRESSLSQAAQAVGRAFGPVTFFLWALRALLLLSAPARVATFFCVKRSNSSYGLCIKCSNCCYVCPLPLVGVGGRVAGLIKITASADVGPRSHVYACLRILF